MRLLILIIAFLSFFNPIIAQEDTKNLERLKKFEPIKELDFDELRKGFEKIRAERTGEKKGFDFNASTLKKFIPFAILLIIIFNFMNTKEEEKQEKKETKKKTKASKFVEEHNRLHKKNISEEKGDFNIYVDHDTIETQDYITVFGKGPINIKSNKLKYDVFKAKIVAYVLDKSEKNNPVYLKCTTPGLHDEEYLLCSSREMEIPIGAEYFEWSRVVAFPSQLVVPPKKGKRKLVFKLFFSNLDAKFEKGIPKKDKNSEIYIEKNSEFEIDYQEPGFLETKEFADDVNRNTIQLGMALANADGHMQQKEIDIIKNWTKSQYGWNILDFLQDNRDLNSFPLENEDEKKAELSFFISNAYDDLKNKRLSMSKITGELNEKATSAQKYEAMKLLLDVAGSDDKWRVAEDTLLNKTAKALNLDLRYFQEMKSVAIANIADIEHSETMDETVFNLTEDMSKSQKCKRLREEYSKWNRQTNNSNQGIRDRAKKMVELAANLRKKYGC